jgi:transposase
MMIERGFASREIAAKIGCGSHTTILRLKKKYEETGNVKDKQRPGRPPKLNERNERTIIRRLLTGECTTAVSLTKSIQVNEDIEVSAETIRRVLRKNGFAARAKRKKPLLSKKHREKRRIVLYKTGVG